MATRYVPSIETDLLILKWWSQIAENGGLGDGFSEQMNLPSVFMAQFQAPNVLYYDVDVEGIRAAMWFAPALSGALIHLWARPDFRHGQWRPFAVEAMREVFDVAPILFFTTKSRQVVVAASELGFTIAARDIPTICCGDPGTLGYLTRDDFEVIHGR